MVAYLVVIFGLQSWMKSRKAFDMVNVTRVHNVILCLWSLAMCIGTLKGVYEVYEKHGVRATFCGSSKEAYMMVGHFGYWRYHYYLSKYYELLDTVILVLKKKNLIFLHVFHHDIMVWMSWLWINSNYGTAWWGVFTNTLVHVFMYYYYFVSTMGIQPWWKRYITTGQIIQFCIGMIYAAIHTYLHYSSGGNCGADIRVVWWSQFIVFVFLVLFAHFYRQTYTAGARAGTGSGARRASDTKQA